MFGNRNMIDSINDKCFLIPSVLSPALGTGAVAKNKAHRQ